MTFYYATYYFDARREHPIGYLLGIDDLIEFTEFTLDGKKETLKISGEKILKGRDYIGLIAGSLISIVRPDFSNPLKSLDNVFDDIHEGAYYGDVELLKDSRYEILLAKRHAEKIQLFEISSLDIFSGILRFYMDEGENLKQQLKRDKGLKHRAILLHELIKDSNGVYTGTGIWCSPNIAKYLFPDIEDLLTLRQAKRFLRDLTQIPTPDRVGCPERINLYIVSFDKMGKA